MIYGHTETGNKLKDENPDSSDEWISAYMRGRDHGTYGWSRKTPITHGESYDRGFDGLPFLGESK